MHLLGLLLAGLLGGAAGVWAQLPIGCSWLSNPAVNLLSGCEELDLVAPEGGLGREPVRWLPTEWRPPNAQPVAIADLTLRTSCEALWGLQEAECTCRVSSTWPSPGLQAGPGYLYYRLLVGARSTARRVNVTCALQDWQTLLRTRGGASSGSGGAPLAPCGTATVTTGPQLLEALQQLQMGHARVLVTLDASMALPAEPTPQRDASAPDDATPLVRIYRNATLVGAGASALVAASPPPAEGGSASAAVTQLDLRLRRNAFEVAAAAAELESGGSQAVLVLADLQLANTPRGPPSSWPIGLLGLDNYGVGMDRSGAHGVQMVRLRVGNTFMPGEFEYFNYWYYQSFSYVKAEAEQAAWVKRLGSGPKRVLDDDGWALASDLSTRAVLIYNVSIAPTVVRAPIIQPDFDLWTSVPPRPPNRTQPLAYLPPSSFAVARSAAELLALLQEAWAGGPRAILLPADITLRPGEWPQDGAALSYNATLVGPITGQPVTLYASGLQLVKSAAGGGGVTALPAQLQLLRLRMVGWSPPLRVGGVQAAGELNATEGLRRWRDRCWSSGASDPATPATPLRYELYGCTLEVPQASLEALHYYTAVTACAAAEATPAAAAGCGLQRLLALPAGVLLRWAAGIGAQAALGGANASTSNSVAFALATLGGGLLVNSSLASPSGERTPGTEPVGSTSDAAAVDEDVPCGSASLLLELRSLLPAQLDVPAASPGRPSSTPTAAVVGGAVGGSAAAVLCAAAAVMLAQRVRRRRRERDLGKPVASVGDLSSVARAPSPPSVLRQGPIGDGHQPTLASGTAYVEDRPSSSNPRETESDWRLTFSSLPDGGEQVRPTMLGSSPLDAPLQQQQPRGGPSGGGADVDEGVPWVVMETEMARMITSFQVAVQAATPSAEQSHAPACIQLGRGACGVVMLGEWRGLPAAIKVVLMPLEEKGARRERLAREVALAVTLCHPHLVPTYDFKITPIHAGNAAAIASGQEPLRASLDDSNGVVAMQLRLTMQFCEGGTLRDALQRGLFGAPPQDEAEGHAAAELNATSGGTAEPVAVEARAAGGASGGGELGGAAMPAGAGGGSTSAAAAAAGRPSLAAGAGAESNAEGAGAGRVPAAALSIAAASADSFSAAVGCASTQVRSWSDVTAVCCLPLALLAALDVLSGLEYLHKRGVVHGDLTECNILLKQVCPILPAAPPPGTVGGVPGAATGGGESRGGGAASTAVKLTAADSADASLSGCAGPRATAALPKQGGTEAHRSTAAPTVAEEAAVPTVAAIARILLRYSFKIADFGLSVMMKGPDQTHASNMAQGTPYFIAPEVVASGRMSTAADCYSFGVCFWLLLHGVALADVRHLLPIHACAPAAPHLLLHASPALPPRAHDILRACLSLQPAERPTASELRRQVEELLREAVGPELSWVLLSAHRVEFNSRHEPQ